MGIFSDQLEKEVRLEYMKPEDVEAAKKRQAAIYVPFGAIEWHGYHNPLGLDGLKAHEQLVGLAARIGGIVYPPIYFGSGGGHLDWPSTFMVSAEPMMQLVAELLRGFEADGYEQAILLSGHYPNRSEFLNAAVTRYKDAGGRMRLLALVENEAPGVGGDHAAKFETSSMLYLNPQTVSMQRLAVEPRDDLGAADQIVNYMVEEYQGHPCYGLLGIDPRAHASVAVGKENTDFLLDFLERWLTADLNPPTYKTP